MKISIHQPRPNPSELSLPCSAANGLAKLRPRPGSQTMGASRCTHGPETTPTEAHRHARPGSAATWAQRVAPGWAVWASLISQLLTQQPCALDYKRRGREPASWVGRALCAMLAAVSIARARKNVMRSPPAAAAGGTEGRRRDAEAAAPRRARVPPAAPATGVEPYFVGLVPT